ncbi:MAG: hypothetical protein V1922_02945 [bacterium]
MMETPTSPKNLEAFQALLEIDEKERSIKAREGYTRAYMWSVFLPPLGVYYLVKYLVFSNRTPSDIKAGWVSFALTIASLLVSTLLLAGVLNSATSINPQQSGDMLKELTTPENQKSIKELFR